MHEEKVGVRCGLLDQYRPDSVGLDHLADRTHAIVQLVQRFYENVIAREPGGADFLSDDGLPKKLSNLSLVVKFHATGFLETDEQKSRVSGASRTRWLVVETGLDAWIQAVRNLDNQVPQGDPQRGHTQFESMSFSKPFQPAAGDDVESKRTEGGESPFRRFWLESDIERINATIKRLQRHFAIESDGANEGKILSALKAVAQASPAEGATSKTFRELARQKRDDTQGRLDKHASKEVEIESLDTLIKLLDACEHAGSPIRPGALSQ